MIKLKLPKGRESIVPANPIKRIGAFLIDLFILRIIVFSSFISYFSSNSPKETGGFASTYAYIQTHQSTIMQMYYVFIAMGLIILIYFAFMEYKYSQTIGKMVFGLYIQSEDSKEITFWQSVLRNIYLIPIFPLFILWVVDPIYILFRQQRLSEVFSKTKTVEVLKYGY